MKAIKAIVGIIVTLVLLSMFCSGADRANPAVRSEPTAVRSEPLAPAVPQPKGDEALSEWGDEMIRIAHGYSTSMTAVGSLFELAVGAPGIMVEDVWVSEVHANLSQIIAYGDLIQRMTVPAPAASVHAEMKIAAELFSSGARLTAVGIDNLDVNSINEATQKWSQGNAHLLLAIELTDDILR